MSWTSTFCIFFIVFTSNSYWNGGLGSTFGTLGTFWPEVPNSSSFFPEANPTASGNHVGQVHPSDYPTLQYQLSALMLHVPLTAAWKATGDAGFTSQSLVGKMWGQVHERASHIAYVTRKQKNSGTQLAIFISFGPELEATALLFYFQLNLSGSTFRHLPRGLFPWQL